MPSLTERIKKSWNAFLGRDPTYEWDIGPSSYLRPDRMRFTRGVDKSIVSTIYNRIAVDSAQITILHAKLNEEEKYQETIYSNLNNVLTLSANLDQTGRAFIQDAVMSMLDEGVVAIVPTIADVNREITQVYDIEELRAGKIIEWHPHKVKVRLYNEDSGNYEELLLDKNIVSIVENPFYSIMNEPNSLAQRLIRVLAQLDRTNERNSSGKLDMIIQLPFPIKSPAQQKLATHRKEMIEAQLTNSQYGLAYIDATEKVVQLNRSLENNLWAQATELQKQLFNQFGLSENIFNGTANEEEQLNYYNRAIEPILSAITLEMKRKFLTKNARSRGESIVFFRDPFKLVPVEKIANIADSFTRNEIMSSNDIRSIIGMKPSDDPRADELINANINQANDDPRAGFDNNNTTSVDDLVSKFQNTKI